ncbi:hypothetical protein [Glaciibacter sp. 2TAF33]|uniref:hypothetical protein n=1 Tax=Glaciibacter sp. 2TAF33 TaxID=3233015 RepID=UPI003F9066A2
MKLKRILAVAVAFALLGAGVTVVSGPAPAAQAADARQFDPGNIISDATFFDGGAMVASEVQSFLDSKVSACRSGYTCLKNYSQATTTRAAEAGRCNSYLGAPSESAATIITRVGIACGISQKALLVLLEKEQGLVTDTWPTERQYRSATGYGCPDTADCDTAYYGFFNQVYMAALQFKRYAANPTGWNHIAGRVNNIRFNPNAACGSSAVLIQNQATAGLYNYTPYQPNASALANLYGTGDACGAYGNRNFWRMFTDWFGSPNVSSSLLRTPSNASVFLVSGDYKYPVPSMDIVGALSPLGQVGFVSQSYLDRFTTSHLVGRTIRANNGAIYFYDAGIKLPVVSCGQAVDYGGSCAADGYVQLTDAQIASFSTGPALGPVLGTTAGNRYFVTAGTKREILDDQSQALAGLPSGYNVLTEGAVATLPLAAPVIRDSAFALTRSTRDYVLLAGGLRHGIARGSEGSIGAVARTTGALSAASMALIPAAPKQFSGLVTANGGGPVNVLASDGRYELTAGGLSDAHAPIAVAPGFTDSYPAKGLIQAGSFIKSPESASVYIVMANDIRPISGWGALLALTTDGSPVISVVPSSVISMLTTGPVALTAGTLVRSPQNATVYFIDGVTSRIAFSDFVFPSEAGFGGLVYASEDILQAYPLHAKLMKFALSCGPQKYVSAGGQVHPVDASRESLYPFDYVAVDQFTCGQMKQGAPAPSFIRTADGAIFQLVAGQKRPVTSMARLGELIGNGSWLNVVQSFAAAIPTGPNA